MIRTQGKQARLAIRGSHLTRRRHDATVDLVAGIAACVNPVLEGRNRKGWCLPEPEGNLELHLFLSYNRSSRTFHSWYDGVWYDPVRRHDEGSAWAAKKWHRPMLGEGKEEYQPQSVEIDILNTNLMDRSNRSEKKNSSVFDCKRNVIHL